MIPKIIHYCWFGDKPLPLSALECIDSWKRYFPNYTIKEWNEENFDVSIIPYTRDAYQDKKYAFVSDFARFWILYHNGGIYFDTDVEVIKPFTEVLKKGPFMGLESDATLHKSVAVAPGLGIAAEAKMEVYREILDRFQELSYFSESGNRNGYTMIPMITELFLKSGLKGNSTIEHIRGINIYPKEYFNPMDSSTGIIQITDKTLSIHKYDSSWIDHHTLRFQLHLLKNKINNLLGYKIVSSLHRLFR
ncbi:glycosyltransferase family 32 protein [Prevotella sp. kh1p2]|uniref:glycosyltransferase family 32 protein n=1 Tax=Prevotella sp. kh1p2 TaxID=1761883 RepID=UPI0008D0EA9C|nr:glycosyltransferase [Prevotella sp. kh1p2]SET10969.1 Glycosyltransferase sugar-binding region containing DXD motif-containing protein [Prevotella sp. kh1p2]SNU11835.1 Glycosyltransferase sugar-binding region containing DXD motif-containing protein [Prevotellaceae bacterium KH2P17]